MACSYRRRCCSSASSSSSLIFDWLWVCCFWRLFFLLFIWFGFLRSLLLFRRTCYFGIGFLCRDVFIVCCISWRSFFCRRRHFAQFPNAVWLVVPADFLFFLFFRGVYKFLLPLLFLYSDCIWLPRPASSSFSASFLAVYYPR